MIYHRLHLYLSFLYYAVMDDFCRFQNYICAFVKPFLNPKWDNLIQYLL